MQTSAIRKLAISASLLVAAGFTHAGDFYEKDGVAIKGFDAVAYFTESRAVKGSGEHTATYKGSTFHFASAANRDLFAANPEKYAPQYDGFCAYGVAKGAKAKIEGEAFKIVDGKLYLNYDAKVQVDWDKDVPTYVMQANKNWESVSKITKVIE